MFHSFTYLICCKILIGQKNMRKNTTRPIPSVVFDQRLAPLLNGTVTMYCFT